MFSVWRLSWLKVATARTGYEKGAGMNWLSKNVLPKIKALVNQDQAKENLWVKCKSCNQMIFHRDFEEQNNTCSTCGAHMAMLFDDAKAEIVTLEKAKDDPLQFKDMKRYTDRLRDSRGKTGIDDAITVGYGV